LALHREQRNPGLGGFLMNFVDIESSIGLDRLATWNEVRCAMAFSPRGAFALVGACDNFLDKTNSDFRGSACLLPEDIMSLAIIGEMPDFISN
jgi:hypothetical protein